MSGLPDDLARSAAAGLSTGARTFTALAVQAFTAADDAPDGPDAVLARPRVRGVLGLLAVGELVMDKLPMTPSRLELPGLAGRIVAGAACGAIIARRDISAVVPGSVHARVTDPTALPGESVGTSRTVACALVGVVGAAASSWAGTRWRSGASSRLGRDWVGAVLEDAAAAGLAVGAARAR